MCLFKAQRRQIGQGQTAPGKTRWMETWLGHMNFPQRPRVNSLRPGRVEGELQRGFNTGTAFRKSRGHSGRVLRAGDLPRVLDAGLLHAAARRDHRRHVARQVLVRPSAVLSPFPARALGEFVCPATLWLNLINCYYLSASLSATLMMLTICNLQRLQTQLINCLFIYL